MKQFFLLLWKNFVLQKRRVCVTVFEILMPIGFAALFVIIRVVAKSEKIEEPTIWPSFGPSLNANDTLLSNGTKLLYTPKTQLVEEIIQAVDTAISTTGQTIELVGYDSESALVDEYLNNKAVWAGVMFDGDYNTTLPERITYSLRVALLNDDDEWNTKSTFPFYSPQGPRSKDDLTGGRPYYKDTGFLYLQYLIDKVIIEHETNLTDLETSVTTLLQRMPYPPYVDDNLNEVMRTSLPIFIVLSFILNALQITRNIAQEKERNLKEAMKMMGLSTFIYWVSWFVKNLIYLVIAMIVYTAFFKIPLGAHGKVLNNTDPTLFFFFLFCYALATIAFCFMISTFFNKANISTFAAGILFFLTYTPYSYIVNQYETMSRSLKLFSCILSNTAMSLGCSVISIYESSGEGAKWNNFHKPGVVDDNFTLLDAIWMLLLDAFLYMLVAWYVDNIHPGEYGVAQPFYFPFTPSYWCGERCKTHGDSHRHGDLADKDDSHFEADPKDMKVGISIQRLRKAFGSGKGRKVAVENMTLNMFEGQITSLLGHNGAGKTTTMSMLTGFLTPTSGTAYVNGYSIRSEIASVRKNLGLCPQHNILFDLLTVEEHLKFFAQLKGCPSKHLKSEVDEMIKVVGLESKRYALSQTLSGGQKRKLSVGIALIAFSKVIILDEPTSGMDPAARRQTWEILQRYRKGRTIILTTHFMDEADILGDRIAIMSEGVVKCCGSSLFLKKQYGAGYHLIIVKTRDCDVDRVTAFVQKHIPTATLDSEISAEVSYLLPFDQSTKFERLFLEFEEQMENLGVSSFGTSATTMEEVFLKVGESAEKDNESIDDIDSSEKTELCHTNVAYGSFSDGIYRKVDENGANRVQNGNLKDLPSSVAVPIEETNAGKFIAFNLGIKKNHGVSLIVQQFWGMFIKKVIHTWRNRIVTIVQLVLPIIFIINALLVEKTIPTPGDEPSLNLNLAKFEGTDVAYSSGLNATAVQTGMASVYETLFPGERTQFVTREGKNNFSSMNDFFISSAKSVGKSTFNKKYIVAGEFQEEASFTNTTSYFNGQPFHSPAIALAYMMDGLFQYFTGNSTRSISTLNAPFPKRLEDSKNNIYFSTGLTGFIIALEVLFGMSFMVTTFIIFLIKEKAVGAKHIQVVSGVGPGAFWFSNFLWDIINYTIPVFGILIVFAGYQTEAYVDNGRLGIVFLLYVVFGWSVLPFVYMFHSLFRTPAAGMVAVSFINILTGLVILLAVYILSIPSLGTEDIGKAIQWIGIIFFPNYNLGQAHIDMYTNYGYADICEKANYEIICPLIAIKELNNPCCFPDHCGDTCFTFYKNYLAWNSPGIGRYLFFMLLQGFCYFGIVLSMEYNLFSRIRYAIRGDQGMTPAVPMHHGGQVLALSTARTEDSDVADEMRRLEENPINSVMQTDSLILKNISKYYGSYCAVNNVSVGVPPNECFGLLGQNGAGKTTIFKMMTGDVDLSRGDAYLSAFSVKTDIKQVQRNLGYCPQFDALIDQMTGRETLTMYARLRGIHENQITTVVNALLEIMMLNKHADKQASQYSGGNKRKLSTAISLIGDPPFIFLDEPTTGMDPAARRQLWNVLSQVRASGRTLVLTSHSMEECDALCTKIVIMVNGKFVCLGSPQHLKNKFGHGYTLMCRMGLDPNGAVASVEPLIQFVQSTFPSSQVFDDQQGYVHFQIPDTSIKLAQIFGKMEEAKQLFQMDDYSVHQTTLEQIFLTFTRNQVPPADTKNPMCGGILCCCK